MIRDVAALTPRAAVRTGPLAPPASDRRLGFPSMRRLQPYDCDVPLRVVLIETYQSALVCHTDAMDYSKFEFSTEARVMQTGLAVVGVEIRPVQPRRVWPAR
jgi:hypothetical protein